MKKWGYGYSHQYQPLTLINQRAEAKALGLIIGPRIDISGNNKTLIDNL